MTQRRIDPTLYIAAADEFQAITESASTRLSDARSSLRQFARMAGDDPGGEQFAEGYDTMARNALQALSDIAVLSNTIDRAIMQSGWNHAAAEEAAGGKPAGAFAVRPARTPITVGAPPSAYGGTSGQPEAWDVVKDFVGMMWPNADTDKLRSAGSTWDVVERDVRALATEIRQADNSLMGLNSLELEKLRSEVNEFARDVSSAAGDISEVGDLCRQYADDVKEAHREVIEMLVQLAVEIAATVAIGAALSVFTFGASAVVAGGGITARIIMIAQRIVSILVRVSGTAARLVARLAAISARIVPLATRFQRTARIVVSVTSGTLAAGGSELAVQRGDANLLVAMGGGFVGGAVTDTVALAFGKYGQRVLVQALAGGAGGATSGASSGLLAGTGVDITQVIIGGAGGTVAGGGFAIRGRRGGNATSADPGRGNVEVPGANGPRPVGGDGGRPGDGGGAIGTRPDYDGPQVSGGNDAGAGSGSGGGAGRQPDYDGPQVSGGNDAGGGAGGAGDGVRVPEGEAPQSPHIEVTPEPTQGGADAPTQGGADVPTQGGADAPTQGGTDASAPGAHAPGSHAPGSHAPGASDDIGRKFDDLQADLDRQFDDLQTRTDQVFDDLQADVDRQFDELRTQLESGEPTAVGGESATPGDNLVAGSADGGDTPAPRADDVPEADAPADPVEARTDPVDGADAPRDATDPADPVDGGSGDGGPTGADAPGGSTPPAGDHSWVHHPASLAPIRPELADILDGNAPRGDGWQRVPDADRVESVPYPGPRPDPGLLDGDFAPAVDVNGHAVELGDAARLLDADPTAPYGHRPDGTPYTDGADWSRDNVDRVHGSTYGNMHWAPNDGAVFGTRVRFTDLAAFERVAGNLHIDRLGRTSGSYLGLGGGTFAERGLPPNQVGQNQFWHVNLRPDAKLPAGWSIEVSRIAPAYGQPGGGLQIVVRDAGGSGVKLDRLKDIFTWDAHRFGPDGSAGGGVGTPHVPDGTSPSAVDGGSTEPAAPVAGDHGVEPVRSEAAAHSAPTARDDLASAIAVRDLGSAVPGGDGIPAIHAGDLPVEQQRAIIRREYPGLLGVNSTRLEAGVPGFEVNCTRCVIATDQLFDGRASSAMPVRTTSGAPISDITNALGVNNAFQSTPSYRSITDTMASLPEGSRGVVFIGRDDGSGHVFNVVHDRNGVVFLDAQTGQFATLEVVPRMYLLITKGA